MSDLQRAASRPVCHVNFNNTGNADGGPAGANDTSNFMNENNLAKMTKYYDGI